MKISFKFVLIISILITLSIIITGTISYFVAKQSIEERVKEQLASVSILKSNQFDGYIVRRVADLEGIAQEKQIVALFLKIENQELNQENNSGNMKQLLEERLTHKKDFFEFFIINLDGKVRLSTNEEQEKKFKSNEPYFSNGKKGSFIQYFYYDMSLQKPAMTISTPIKDSKGNLIGILAGRIDLGKISEFMIERSGLGETGETYLVNKFNMVVSDIMGKEGASLSMLINTEGVKNCLKGNTGFSYYSNYQKTSVLGYYVWLPKSEICLLTEINQAEALLPVRRLGIIIIFVGFAIIPVIIFLGMFLSRTITDPLLKLRNATIEIGKGKLETQIIVKTNDEIGDLAGAFNLMSQELNKSDTQLKEYSKNLENQVEKRTSDLNSKLNELKTFQKLTVDRELKMIELKKKIKELEKEQGKKTENK
jgi:HAMP domain-containing protein